MSLGILKTFIQYTALGGIIFQVFESEGVINKIMWMQSITIQGCT